MVALPMSMIPCVGMLSLPLSAIGVLLGGVGLVVAMARQGRGVGFPIAGTAISGMALAFGAVWFLMAGGVSSAVKTIDEARTSSTTTAPPNSSPKPADPPEPTPDSVDVTEGPARAGDIEVQFDSAVYGFVPLDHLGDPARSEKPALMIRLAIRNHSTTRKLDYHTWASGSASLTDSFGNSYRWHRFGIGLRVMGQKEDESILPGENTSDVLVFEKPARRSDWLYLDLPLAAFDGRGVIRFRIPMTRVRWNVAD